MIPPITQNLSNGYDHQRSVVVEAVATVLRHLRQQLSL
jgi:hypothetical protein